MKAIKTETQEQFDRVLEIFEKKGWVWWREYKPTLFKQIWERFNKNTCIDYKNECWYSDAKFYKEEWYEIISFEDFLKEEGIEEWSEWMEVYVSTESEANALDYKYKLILLKKCSDWYVCILKSCEKNFREWKTFTTDIWRYAVPVPKEKPKTEVTMQEIADKFEIAVEDLKIKK